MPNDHVASAPAPSLQASSPGKRLGTWPDRLTLAALSHILPPLDKGRLAITLPSGAATTLGTSRSVAPDRATDPWLRVNRYRGLWRTITRGKLGFAEAYMDGDIDIDDLDAVFNWFLDHETALRSSARWLLDTRKSDHRYHASRDNSRDGSKRNIAAHYDLGNAFYSRWLDAGMSYSSAIYPDLGATLEQAQALKHARILAALELSPGQRLLEIGCGWGSVAEVAARAGAEVRGITLSQEQLEWSRRRLADAGLANTTSFEFEDYRDTQGSFDRIVSIEMIEAVGEAHWPDYFQVLADRLVTGGSGIIQAITIPAPFFSGYRNAPDFIQRYIFPGGMLPTIEAMQYHAAAAGLAFSTLERFGHSYARTLRDWSVRFNASWPEIAALGFDDRFKRMWNYYLSYCAAGFERDCIDVGLYRVVKV